MPKPQSSSPHKGASAIDENPGFRTSPVADNSSKQKKLSNRKRTRPADEDYDELNTFKNEMKEMLSSMFSVFTTNQNERMKTMERHLAELKLHTSPISDIEKSISHMSGQVTDMQMKIDRIEGEKKEIKEQILEFGERIDYIEKNSKKTSIEIRSIPRQQGEKKEDLYNMIKSLLKFLNVEFISSDLKDVYRVPNKLNNNISTLVAEFSNTLVKGTVLEKARRHNKSRDSKLCTRHLGLNDAPSTQIFISELLTAKSKRLYYLARDLARTENFAFCWTSNGNIYLRKREGMPHIHIKNETQLESMKRITAA